MYNLGREKVAKAQREEEEGGKEEGRKEQFTVKKRTSHKG